MDLDVLHFSSTEKYRYRPIEGKIYPPIPTSTAIVMCKILPMLTCKYKGFWVIGYLARNEMSLNFIWKLSERYRQKQGQTPQVK